MKKKNRTSLLRRLSKNPSRLAGIFIVLAVAVAGVAFLTHIFAASPFIAIQASGGSVTSPASVKSDANASNGKYVSFGAATAGSTGSSTSGGSSAGGSNTGVGSNTSGTSTCTKPSWSSSDPEDTDALGTGDVWWVNNDAWSGSAGPQTINVCSQSSWYATSNQPNNGGQVETYPDTEYDIAGRDNATKTIAQYKSITSTFSEAYPSAGSWDAAYDLWTDDWSNETMVWNQWAGTEDYWGSCAEPGSAQNTCVGDGGASSNSQAATINGVAYHFLALGSNCDAANESNCEYIFFRDSQVASGSLDILAIYNWEVANGYAKSSDVPTQLEYGVEVCSTSGTETFPMNGLTFDMN
ncbi:MAG: hypothetical protein WDN66_04890 [Candidatus Saccharibacteria bacterium]